MSISDKSSKHDRNGEQHPGECIPHSYRVEADEENDRLATVLRRRGLHSRRILLIGGAGYIGSVLTSDLLGRGYHVRCFDNLIYHNHHSVLSFLVNPKYEFICGDLTNESMLISALEGVTDVVLLAGLVGDPITKRYPEVSQRINHDGMIDAIRLMNGRGLNKVVFISTCSNYGLVDTNDEADENCELKPLSLYAKAKVAVEEEMMALKNRTDYCPTILRFATAFGISPRMRFDLTLNEFTRDIYCGKELLVYDAETWRPYCHVNDLSRAIWRVVEAPRERVLFEVFNVGGEVNNCTKRMIVDEIVELIPEARVQYKTHGEDPRNYRVKFTKIRERLYFKPRHDVSYGAAELIWALAMRFFGDVDFNRNIYGNYEIDCLST